jgi:hypothetical protein
MPTISMFYGVLIRMFFTTPTSTTFRTSMRNSKGKLPFTPSLKGNYWSAIYRQRNIKWS